MTVIVWVGKNGEMLFNKRRCSRDRAVVAEILSVYGERLCVSAYSASLFEGCRVISALPEVGDGVLFLEDFPLSPALAQANELIVYRFDRVYPADIKLEIPQDFTLMESTEFVGFAHEKITREVYRKWQNEK